MYQGMLAAGMYDSAQEYDILLSAARDEFDEECAREQYEEECARKQYEQDLAEEEERS